MKLSDGAIVSGKGYMRLNFGCPRRHVATRLFGASSTPLARSPEDPVATRSASVALACMMVVVWSGLLLR